MRFLFWGGLGLISVVLLGPKYIKWHLNKYEYGMAYTLFNLLTPPDDYLTPLIKREIISNSDNSFDVTHSYSGKHLITLRGHEEMKYKAFIKCGNNELVLSEKDKLEYVNGEHWLYLYSVPSDLPRKGNCSVLIQTNVAKRFVVKFTKFIHE